MTYFLGGPAKYFVKDMKIAHGHMNLNDTHIDAFKQCLSTTLKN